MSCPRSLRLAALSLSNILLPIAVLVFATGFFPYKPFLPGLARFEDVGELRGGKEELGEKGGGPRVGAGGARRGQEEAVFDRVVFMVVDALRSDFVYGEGSGFGFTQSLIRSGAAIPFTAHATPPTVTMPRVKALTTGSVPSFLDLILNFAESDTSSSLSAQDTWLAQILAANGSIVFYGDDTWLKLFPPSPEGQPFFKRSDGTSSFFVSDFTEVDNNVTRHVPDELARSDWNAMVLHYLGLDHIGHKTGPQGPNMLPKQREMDGIIKMIYEAMEGYEHHETTLLVLAGDHGMNAGGNHGGSGPGETEPALLFASPVFKAMEKRQYECPTLPKEGTEFHYYSKVEQSDLVPALAAMMGMPVSKNSLGVLLPELTGLWKGERRVQLLLQNAKQLLHIVRAKYGGERFDRDAESHAKAMEEGDGGCRGPEGDEEKLIHGWGEVLYWLAQERGLENDQLLEEALYRFLKLAQETMSDTASSYDIPRMVTGMAVAGAALVFAVISSPSLWPPGIAGMSFTLICLLYGVMMFASSYVEEEQHFWYWLTPVWVSILIAKSLRNRSDMTSAWRTAAAGAILLCSHRLAVRWNQTGQKHAGEPDIVHAIFPEHHMLMWLLILLTYIMNGYFIHTRTFAGLLIPELTAFADVSLIVLATVFKLNFTQADAPELVQGLALKLREWSEPFSLVVQARAAFATMAVTGAGVVVLAIRQARGKSGQKAKAAQTSIALTERLSHLLTLFLMTQTRAPNVPLFLALETQKSALGWLLSTQSSSSKEKATKPRTSAVEAATSVLLLSHTYYFCMGGSNSISSIDLSNAYNGVADYNIAAVGLLLFSSNWAGPIWWCSAAVLLCTQRPAIASRKETAGAEKDRDWVMVEREKLQEDAKAIAKQANEQPASEDPHAGAWFVYVASMTAFVATSLLAVMAACTALRTHLFIWTVFSPKYLYALAWSLGWHLVVNVGFGSLLYQLCSIA
ncbi:major facilitator superfamily transporter protein [Saxophila tyrrhenica]|uniref:GPI ethanolamine phosphate transferase 2 n=1 Tax=Saxophila tyrrhenica TaxID=1690608 RepID=A0AAV9P3Y0_9PEZI|nr:major facilitator superfamily transporter protein [Saxophila tyrrhenica]